MDVNTQTNGQATGTESSPVQGQQTGFESQTLDQSAGTLNADVTGEAPKQIPYERFQEVNERMKLYKDQAGMLQQQFEAANQNLTTFRQFEEFLTQNPVIAEKFKEVVIANSSGNGADLNQALSPLFQQVQTMGSQLTRLNENQYVSQFSQIIGQDRDIAPFAKEMEFLVRNQMAQVPGVLNDYRPELLQGAYQQARMIVDAIRRGSSTAYAGAKNSVTVPPTAGTGASAPAENKVYGSTQAREVALARRFAGIV